MSFTSFKNKSYSMEMFSWIQEKHWKMKEMLWRETTCMAASLKTRPNTCKSKELMNLECRGLLCYCVHLDWNFDVWRNGGIVATLLEMLMASLLADKAFSIHQGSSTRGINWKDGFCKIYLILKCSWFMRLACQIVNLVYNWANRLSVKPSPLDTNMAS